MCIGLLLPNMKLVCRIYASVFIFRLVSVLSVADLFSVRVFIFGFGSYRVFCVGSRLVIPTLYRILSCRSCSVVFRLFIGCCRGLLFCAFPAEVSSFTVCRGIVVVDMWDFKWVICLVDVVPDRIFYEVYGLYLFCLFRDFCV